LLPSSEETTMHDIMPGGLCYIQLAVTDLTAATTFYREVFAWKVTPSGESYSMFAMPGGQSGGFWIQKSRPADGPIDLFIQVDDIPAALDRIVKAGGAVDKPKTDVGGGHGFLAYFRDPSGNKLGLWSPT
jgi:uncharacterized protein